MQLNMPLSEMMQCLRHHQQRKREVSPGAACIPKPGPWVIKTHPMVADIESGLHAETDVQLSDGARAGGRRRRRATWATRTF